MRPVYDEIVALTDEFSRQYLNEECAKLCRELAAALARKRPSPLGRGSKATWAYGIIHAIASVNFLFNASEEPHTSVDEMTAALGVKKTTGQSKSKQIRGHVAHAPV